MKKRNWLLVALVVLTIGFISCSQAEKVKKAEEKVESKVEEAKEEVKTEAKEDIKAEKVEEVEKAEKAAKQVDTIAVLKTEKGNIKIKLYMDEAPITAGNFKDLIERGFYNGTTFHRVIPGFVIQGGDPKGNGTGGFIDPETGKERTIPMEKTDLRHDKFGVVAMARTADPNSASSQFFLDLDPQPGLDPGGYDPYGYAILGQAIGEESKKTMMRIANENVPSGPGSDRPADPVKIKKAYIED